MKKLLGIVVLGLLWCNFSYAENITLIKCKDVGDKKMDRSKEKYYFTIDYKSNEVTEVWIYTNEWVASMKKAKEETAFESWADQTANEYATEPKDEEDRREKLKALNDIQKNPDLMSDPKMKAAVIKRRMELQRAKQEGVAFEDLKPYIEQHLKDGGDKATAIESAIEQFNTEDNAPDMVVRDPEDEAEDKEQEIAKDQAEAEKINTDLDRIKQLANLS